MQELCCQSTQIPVENLTTSISMPKYKDKMLRPIPFIYDFNLLPINFQSRLIQDLEGSLENSMSSVILKHVSLHMMNSKLLPKNHI
jgi:hypothetical protein